MQRVRLVAGHKPYCPGLGKRRVRHGPATRCTFVQQAMIKSATMSLRDIDTPQTFG
jgi:hypothetical protein